MLLGGELALCGRGAVLNLRNECSQSSTITLPTGFSQLPSLPVKRGAATQSIQLHSIPFARTAHHLPSRIENREVVLRPIQGRVGMIAQHRSPPKAGRGVDAEEQRLRALQRVQQWQQRLQTREEEETRVLNEGRGGGEEIIAEQRMKALRRIRDQRERREREEAEERQRENEVRSSMQLKEREARDAQERRDRFRAEVLAVNRLLAQREEAAWEAYADSRKSDLQQIEQRHAEELLAHQHGVKELERSCMQRMKMHDSETRTEKQRQQKEQEAREARREKQREEARTKELEREIWRAQVYALNKLMRTREESIFAAFQKAQKPRSTTDILGGEQDGTATDTSVQKYCGA